MFLTTHYMDEADRVAHRIAIIDHGGIVAQGTPQQLKEQTNSESLEHAFLSLTGSTIRDEARLPPTRYDRSQRCGPTPMSAIYILWLREIKRYMRSHAQIVASLGQPLLYLLVFGFGLGPVFQKAGNGSYLQFVAPGVISMTSFLLLIFSGIAMLWDRQFGFLKETLGGAGPADSKS